MTSINSETENATALLDPDAFMRPFLDILNDSTSSSMNLSTVRSLALKVFAHPQIFSGFDEFKSRSLSLLPPQGENSPSKSLFNTLDLFSYGTLNDYTSQQQVDKEYYLPLNEPALAKLSQLSVLSCIQQACSNGETSIPYDSLAEALGSTSLAVMQEESASSSSTTSMTNIRDIENVLIRCLYENALKGKLCQKTRNFVWRGERLPIVLSRDVAPEQVSDLLLALEGLGQRLEQSGNDVGKTQHQIKQGLEETAKYWSSVQSQKKMSLEEIHGKGTASGGASSGEGQSSSRFFGGGRQGAGTFSGQGSISSAPLGSGSQGINPRRSSKRSRGGMAGNFLTDAAGFRM